MTNPDWQNPTAPPGALAIVQKSKRRWLVIRERLCGREILIAVHDAKTSSDGSLRETSRPALWINPKRVPDFIAKLRRVAEELPLQRETPEGGNEIGRAHV